MAEITTRRLTTDEVTVFQSVLALFEEVFAMKHGANLPQEYLGTVLGDPHFSVLIAEHDNQVVGALTAYTLSSYYSEKPLLYLYDLAVRATMQRQGVGSTLLKALQNYGQEIGAAEMFVQADLEDGYALDFYQKNGGTPESVVHYTYPIESEK